MTRVRRPSAQTTAVVRALAQDPTAWHYGYQLCQRLGLKAGSVYPILMRLADRGLLETSWEVFERAGYKVLYKSYFNTALFPLVVAARAAGKLLKREGGDDALPPKRINAALKTVFGAERHLMGRTSLPIGVSLALVAHSGQDV